MTEEFPNNSRRAASSKGEGLPPEVEVQIEKIIEGQAVVRKPSGFRRFRRSFIAGDASSVGEHVFWNLLIPSAKDALSDMASTFIDMMIYGEKRNRFGGTGAPTTGLGSTSRINYGGLSTGSPAIGGSSNVVFEPARRANPNEIYLPTRAEAEVVLTKMLQILEKYHAVTVANLYGMVGQSSDYMDSKWGWTNLDGADTKRTRYGVQLLLPPPQDLS